MNWPKPRPKPRMGVRDKRPSMTSHLQWVRRLACSVPGCPSSDVITHHVRAAGDAGTGQKDDRFVVPMCVTHHDEGHQIGWKTFDARYGTDLVETAELLERTSPHRRKWMEKETV